MAMNILTILQNEYMRDFILARAKTYGKYTGLPSEWIPTIIEILTNMSYDSELAIKAVQKEFPQLINTSSEYHEKLRKYRIRKVEQIAERINPFLKNGTVLDFGGQTTDLLEALINKNERISQGFVNGINKDEIIQNESEKIAFTEQISLSETTLGTKSVDTIIVSLVLHHMNVQEREKLINHFTKILKKKGILILIEDTFSETRVQRECDSITDMFLNKFSFEEKMQLLSFLDWQGNRLTRPHPSVPLHYTFKSIEGWCQLFKTFGFNLTNEQFFCNVDEDSIDLIPPKAFMVFRLN
ncbi:MAG: methyltransferase domain-containing protein [Bacteroidales bacterium]|nr:MAG: methyltransferase domain-containing protein [Bacteroidales bacterium]